MTPRIEIASLSTATPTATNTTGAVDRVINLQSTLERFGYDSDLFREMAQLFQQDALENLELLEAAATERRSQEIALRAHSLKGLAANFDARKAVQAALEVERLAQTEQVDTEQVSIQQRQALSGAIGALRTSIEEVVTTLSPYASEA